jgi:hypothetical protein
MRTMNEPLVANSITIPPNDVTNYYKFFDIEKYKDYIEGVLAQYESFKQPKEPKTNAETKEEEAEEPKETKKPKQTKGKKGGAKTGKKRTRKNKGSAWKLW